MYDIIQTHADSPTHVVPWRCRFRNRFEYKILPRRRKNKDPDEARSSLCAGHVARRNQLPLRGVRMLYTIGSTTATAIRRSGAREEGSGRGLYPRLSFGCQPSQGKAFSHAHSHASRRSSAHQAPRRAYKVQTSRADVRPYNSDGGALSRRAIFKRGSSWLTVSGEWWPRGPLQQQLPAEPNACGGGVCVCVMWYRIIIMLSCPWARPQYCYRGRRCVGNNY